MIENDPNKTLNRNQDVNINISLYNQPTSLLTCNDRESDKGKSNSNVNVVEDKRHQIIASSKRNRHSPSNIFKTSNPLSSKSKTISFLSCPSSFLTGSRKQ